MQKAKKKKSVIVVSSLIIILALVLVLKWWRNRVERFHVINQNAWLNSSEWCHEIINGGGSNSLYTVSSNQFSAIYTSFNKELSIFELKKILQIDPDSGTPVMDGCGNKYMAKIINKEEADDVVYFDAKLYYYHYSVYGGKKRKSKSCYFKILVDENTSKSRRVKKLIRGVK